MVARSFTGLLICWALLGCHGPNPAYLRGNLADGPRGADANTDGPGADLPAGDLPHGTQPPDLAMSDLPADAAGPDAAGPDAAGPDAGSPDLAPPDAPAADAPVADAATEPLPPPPPDLTAELPPDGPGMLPAPVAYWRLDTTANLETPDDLGRNPGMMFNGAARLSGGAPVMFANPFCASLDGTNDYISLGIRGLPGLNQVKSVSLWFWSSQASSVFRQNILSIENRSAGQSIHLGLENGEVALWRWTSASASATAPTRATVQQWHHLGYSFDGQTHRLYVDGAMVDSASFSLNSVAVAELYLGTHHPTELPPEWFRGRIDDVRIYDRALTAGEIAILAAGRW